MGVLRSKLKDHAIKADGIRVLPQVKLTLDLDTVAGFPLQDRI